MKSKICLDYHGNLKLQVGTSQRNVISSHKSPRFHFVSHTEIKPKIFWIISDWQKQTRLTLTTRWLTLLKSLQRSSTGRRGVFCPTVLTSAHQLSKLCSHHFRDTSGFQNTSPFSHYIGCFQWVTQRFAEVTFRTSLLFWQIFPEWKLIFSWRFLKWIRVNFKV